MEILRSLHVPAINLVVPAQGPAGYVRRNGYALASPREQGIIAPVKDDTGVNLAFRLVAQLVAKHLRDAGADIKDIFLLQTVTQRRIHKGIERLARLHKEPVIALVIIRAQVVCLGIEKLTSER